MVMYANEVEKWKLPEIKKINFNTYICQDKTHVCYFFLLVNNYISFIEIENLTEDKYLQNTRT